MSTSYARSASAPSSRPGWILDHLAIAPAQFYRWAERYGRVNAHNGQIPRDHWVTAAERAAILAYHDTHAPEIYRPGRDGDCSRLALRSA
ncbi:MAG TPA: hypothetical protein VH277_17920 [Gemmatimonadaceae bacterium]|nr:hypothetical protein [Gemmatimonadaceae bacterium]